jgi:hypothetical protein
MLQVFDHLSMQSSQFLANTRQPSHPSHEVTGCPPGPRPNLKPTLQHAFGEVVNPYTTNGVIMPVSYKRVVKEIHTKAIAIALDSRAPNKVLGVPAPTVNLTEEQTLPHAVWTTLRRLRGGQCNLLNDYKHMISSVVDELCPGCFLSPHTTSHLFSCPVAPTLLRPIGDVCVFPPPLLSPLPVVSPSPAPLRSLLF